RPAQLRPGDAGQAALAGAQQGRPDVRGRGAGAGGGDRCRTWLGTAVVAGLGDRRRGDLADHAGGAGFLRPPARGRAGRGRHRRRAAGRPGCGLSRCTCRAVRCPARAGTPACRQQKTRHRPGFSMIATTRPRGRAPWDQAALSALMRAVRRLLWRAALFLWIRPRALNRSSSGCAALKASWAPAASLASSALITFLTAVRSIERWLLLRMLRTTACLARFLEDLMLATMNSWMARTCRV